MTLEQATLAFLIALFLAAEAYRIVRGARGVIVTVEDPTLLLVPLPTMNVRVRLDDGRVVLARLDACTSCMGHLKCGDQVRVARTREGWVVGLPWFNRLGCANSMKSPMPMRPQRTTRSPWDCVRGVASDRLVAPQTTDCFQSLEGRDPSLPPATPLHGRNVRAQHQEIPREARGKTGSCSAPC